MPPQRSGRRRPDRRADADQHKAFVSAVSPIYAEARGQFDRQLLALVVSRRESSVCGARWGRTTSPHARQIGSGAMMLISPLLEEPLPEEPVLKRHEIHHQLGLGKHPAFRYVDERQQRNDTIGEAKIGIMNVIGSQRNCCRPRSTCL